MFDYQSVTEYQLEITSYCNAACPQCPRNSNGSGINPHMPLRHLDRFVIDRAFDEHTLCLRLRQIVESPLVRGRAYDQSSGTVHQSQRA